jgi:hypothetical protein
MPQGTRFRDRTGPSKPSSRPQFCTTHFKIHEFDDRHQFVHTQAKLDKHPEFSTPEKLEAAAAAPCAAEPAGGELSEMPEGPLMLRTADNTMFCHQVCRPRPHVCKRPNVCQNKLHSPRTNGWLRTVSHRPVPSLGCVCFVRLSISRIDTEQFWHLRGLG